MIGLAPGLGHSVSSARRAGQVREEEGSGTVGQPFSSATQTAAAASYLEAEVRSPGGLIESEIGCSWALSVPAPSQSTCPCG
jgi:hypothetical protein